MTQIHGSPAVYATPSRTRKLRMVASQRLTLCLTHVMRFSRIGQGTAKALTILNGVQALEIFRVVLPGFDVKINKDRSIFL